MTTTITQILIFKTNIQTVLDKHRVQHLLDTNTDIDQWNIDQQDVDCVLRIISDTLTPEQIITLISNSGFTCSELE